MEKLNAARAIHWCSSSVPKICTRRSSARTANPAAAARTARMIIRVRTVRNGPLNLPITSLIAKATVV